MKVPLADPTQWPFDTTVPSCRSVGAPPRTGGQTSIYGSGARNAFSMQVAAAAASRSGGCVGDSSHDQSFAASAKYAACCICFCVNRRLGEPARSAVQTPALPLACGGGDGRSRVAAHRRAGGAWMLRAADADSGGADHAMSAVRAAIAMPSSISSMPTARMDRSA